MYKAVDVRFTIKKILMSENIFMKLIHDDEGVKNMVTIERLLNLICLIYLYQKFFLVML